jgi:tetratricopeptide (TPR) repeat protein
VLYDRALAIRIDKLGPEHRDVAWTLRDMGKLSHLRGNPEAALPRFEESLRIFEAALGKHHPDLAEMLPDYAKVMRDLGRDEEADAMDARAAEILAGTEIASE